MDVGSIITECFKAAAPVIVGIGAGLITAKTSVKNLRLQVQAQSQRDAEARKLELQEKRYITFVTLLSKIKSPLHEAKIAAELSAVVNEIYLTAEQSVVEKVFDYLSLITVNEHMDPQQENQYRDFVIATRKALEIKTNSETFPPITLLIVTESNKQ